MFIKKKILFNGINFYNLEYNDVLKKIKKGGLIVIPSGPGLATIRNDKEYHTSLKNSDVAILDSGFFCLLLLFIKFIKTKKFSGYLLIKKILDDRNLKNDTFFFVDPNKQENIVNRKYLLSSKIIKSFYYIAPIYKKKIIEDFKLLKILQEKKPKFIIINIAGGIQEKLGYYLKKNCSFNPIIICSGAAISFLTKEQAPINDFHDKMYLGWLVRIMYNPLLYLPRYFKAFKLFFLILVSNIKVTLI